MFTLHGFNVKVIVTKLNSVCMCPVCMVTDLLWQKAVSEGDLKTLFSVVCRFIPSFIGINEDEIESFRSLNKEVRRKSKHKGSSNPFSHSYIFHLIEKLFIFWSILFCFPWSPFIVSQGTKKKVAVFVTLYSCTCFCCYFCYCIFKTMQIISLMIG